MPILKNPRSKGTRFELEIADKIRKAGLDPLVRRTPMSGAIKGWSGDLTTPNIPIHWELKKQETWSPLEYYKQAMDERATGRYIPVVVMGKNNIEPFTFLSFNDFLTILYYALKGGLKENT